MTVTLAPIRPILLVEDICDLLRMSEAQFWALKRAGFFDRHHLLVPIHPEIDRRRRFSGEPFVAFLNDKNQLKLLRASIRAVEASGLARASSGE